MEFYSSRKERLEHSSKEVRDMYKKQKKGFFNRNPHLKILFIDLFIVILFSTVIIPLFLKLSNEIKFKSYEVIPKAIKFEDDILLTIKVKKYRNRETNSEITIEIIENDDIIKEKSQAMPTEYGSSEYVTFKLEKRENIEAVNIRITSGDYIKERVVQVEY